MDFKLEPEEIFDLAATDLFVEKAQHVLTRRSNVLFISGVASIAVTVLLLIAAAAFIGWRLVEPLDPNLLQSTQALVLRIFQSTALSAFVLVGVKYMISLGGSFFHEAISLRERRHTLRFGRLYVYLTKGDVDLEQLEAAFQWNKETRTSFLDMKPEVVAETLLHRIVDAFAKAPPETMKVLADALSKAKEEKKKKKED